MSDTNDMTIGRLIRRSILGTITPAELDELDAWVEASADHRRFYEWATSGRHMAEEYRSRRVIDPSRPARDMELRLRHKRRATTLRHIRSMAAAAAVIIALSLLLWRFMPGGSPDTSRQPLTASAPARETINLDSMPSGTAKAVLTTPSGQSRTLTALQSGSATATLLPSSATAADARELRLDVPRGGEFKIVLEDSTEVWLNSQSTLRYPETFGPAERRIALSGEAYLQVRKDPSRPFYVETDEQVIRVYGTSFNVRAYPDETATYTTLETGTISLALNGGTSGEVFLSRGHQATLHHNSDHLDMAVVDPDVVTSWRHGRFVFEDQPLDRIMRDLSRWYDFSYEFSDPELGRQIFMGSIPRYSDFRTAIQILENCGDIRFTVTPDNRILITRN